MTIGEDLDGTFSIIGDSVKFLTDGIEALRGSHDLLESGVAVLEGHHAETVADINQLDTHVTMAGANILNLGLRQESLEQRIETLEQMVAQLQQQPVPPPSEPAPPTITPVPEPPVPVPPPPVPGPQPTGWTLQRVQEFINDSWSRAGLSATWEKPILPPMSTPNRAPASWRTEGASLGNGLRDVWVDGLDLTASTGSALLIDGSIRVVLTRPRISADAYAIWANNITDLVVIEPIFTEIAGTQDQSLFRLVNAKRVFVSGDGVTGAAETDSTDREDFTNRTRHTFRIHGDSSDIHLIDMDLHNGGIMIGEMPEDIRCLRLRLEDLKMNVTQPGDIQLSRTKCQQVVMRRIVSDKRGLSGDAAYSGLLSYNGQAGWTVSGNSVLV